jgi:hypothetical protein
MLRNVFPWLVLALACIACEPVNRYFNLQDDNWIEESGEAVLKYKTGIDVDFTPSTPE